jgi:uncharacterized protein YndB with AHSA1/START domain
MTTLFHKVAVHAQQTAVFDALTTSAGLKAWYAADIQGNLGKGGEFTVSSSEHESFTWKVVELISDTSIQWRCLLGPKEAIGTVVTFKLSETGEGKTSVECEHSGHPISGKALESCNTFWGILLGHLKSYVETSNAVPALV